MAPKGDPKVHYWHVQRMAKSLGCDMAQVMSEGRLSSEDWMAMVERCRDCQSTCACRRWLRAAELEDAPREAAMPGCENALVFAHV